ncbi:MAG: hypothetical protein KJ905_01045 [Nanoarchaeota archaeon]|nr:hypothetical protein [Nanoarchaeota archaeon]MBU1501345.1 hypothetical protein [Nanoarchaeota archaeon]MBU2459291.1 hypothetical protein [Nanoarchaeota archaeon]
MPWETLQKSHSSATEGKITLLKKGNCVSFNHIFIRDNDLRNFPYVKVHINDRPKTIILGFEFVKEGENGFKLNNKHQNNGRVMYSNKLFKKIGMADSEFTNLFTPKKEIVDGKELFILELSKK